MATGFYIWSTTAATNATADSTINWAEGQAPSSVNDSARAMMAGLAKYRIDESGLTTAGSSTAYTVTTNQVFASLAVLDTNVICIIPHTTSGASPTLAVDGLTAKAINATTGVPVSTGTLISGTPYYLRYSNSNNEFLLCDHAAVAASDITTGTLALARGGTNANLSATGGTSQVLQQTSVGGAITVGQLAASNLSDTITGSGNLVKATSPTLTTPTINNPTLTTPAIGVATGTSLAATGAISSSSASAGIGYATGAGGSDAGPISNGGTSTLNKICGKFTTASLAGSTGSNFQFTVSTTSVASTDGVITWIASGATTGRWLISVDSVTGGSFTIHVYCTSTSTDTLVIGWMVIKGVTA